MKTRLALVGGLSALVLGGSMVGCTAGGGGGIASASHRDAAGEGKVAADQAARASRALARRDGAAAIRFAEAAVALAPRDAGYRLLLGQGYLRGGRFSSARTAFADVLDLQPDNGKAALNLALAQIACGDWGNARETLAAHTDTILPGDRGLALTLAGDPATGVALLTQVARSPGSTPQVRQNLALALALAGQWGSARVVAATDMSPAEVDARIEQWAAFAQPVHSYDQVAHLLGVTPAADAGEPVALALNASVPTTAPAETAVVADAAPATEKVETSVAVAQPQPGVTFGPRHEVVQPIAPTLIRATGATKVALAGARLAPPPRFSTGLAKGGGWYVQLGAFGSAGVARDAWSRATRRMPALSHRGPSGTSFSLRGTSFYRLSVGGFTRGEADALCRRYRAQGGACFVRSGAGDQMAQWLRQRTQVASS